MVKLEQEVDADAVADRHADLVVRKLRTDCRSGMRLAAAVVADSRLGAVGFRRRVAVVDVVCEAVAGGGDVCERLTLRLERVIFKRRCVDGLARFGAGRPDVHAAHGLCAFGLGKAAAVQGDARRRAEPVAVRFLPRVGRIAPDDGGRFNVLRKNPHIISRHQEVMHFLLVVIENLDVD